MSNDDNLENKYSSNVMIKVEQMVGQIKAMEPLLGKARVKTFAKKTLLAQVRKNVITKEEYAQLMSKLGYEE